MRDLPRNIGAFSFGNGGAARVSLGIGIGRLQNFDPITIFQVMYPTVWPAAGVRGNFTINGGNAGFRQFATSSDGGVNAARFLMDRDTADLNVTVSVPNLPYAAINKWVTIAVTAIGSGTDSDQLIYGGDLQHPLTPATTYVTQTVGTGSLFASSNNADNYIGGAGTTNSYAGAIAITAVWNKYLRQRHLREVEDQLLSGVIPPDVQGCWYTGAHGPLRVYDQSALHDNVGLNTSAHAVTISGIQMIRGFTLRPRIMPIRSKAGAAAAGYLLVAN